MTASSAKAGFLPVVAAFGAAVSTFMLYASPRPGTMLSSLHGGGVSAVVVFMAFVFCGLWVLRHAPGPAWGWGIGIGVGLATVKLTVMAIQGFDFNQLYSRGTTAWILLTWLGTVWTISCAVAALIVAIGRSREHSVPGAPPGGVGRDRAIVMPDAESVDQGDPAPRPAGPLAVLAAIGASVSVLALCVDSRPGALLSSLHGSVISAGVALVAFTCCGIWVLRHASGSAWRWAVGIGTAMATAQFVGIAVRKSFLRQILVPDNVGWVIVQWVGTTWMITCGLAALIAAVDSGGRSSSSAGPIRDGVFARLVRSLHSTTPGVQRKGCFTLMGIIVASRLPYLVVYWPGIVQFDTFRSYSYARGTYQWESYEPVGSSLFVTATQWLGTFFGWGDAGGVAIGAMTLMLASCAAFTFMLLRMATWGVSRTVWVAALAWVTLLPVFGYFSIEIIKDMPFSVAMLVFLVCIGEVAFSMTGARAWWPWITMAVASIVIIGTRNNGIHVMVLTLPLLLIPLRQLWRRVLLLLVVVAVAYGLYVGPVYAMLHVRPGPQEETYSVPLQQLGRIAKVHSASLSESDREFYHLIFPETPPAELARHYVPGLADPMKLFARDGWSSHSTTAFLAGWSKLAMEYPVTAATATLANTVGYWDPEGPSYDGLTRWSANDVRHIHLGIPSGRPSSGAAGWIEGSGLMPSQRYATGLQDDGYRAVPILGLAMSPGPVCWLWLVCGLLVIRRRARSALAVFIPPAVLVLSFLAGPVSGGQRYSLTLFMAVPLAVAAVAVVTRRQSSITATTEATSALTEDARVLQQL